MPDAAREKVLCTDCGMPSDRGCIRLCSACASEREWMNECENCGRCIPRSQWCCESCFPLFDGESFLDPEDVEITEL